VTCKPSFKPAFTPRYSLQPSDFMSKSVRTQGPLRSGETNKARGYLHPEQGEAGCDEAGRGCLAGPVVAAAVILDPGRDWSMLRDSKTLKADLRYRYAAMIQEGALAWAVGACSPKEIDLHNILKASILSMHHALDALTLKPELILVDGNRFIPWKDRPFRCEIRGDGRWCSIAAAGILAKTHRDSLMEQAHARYPVYGWDRNKGYPTEEHRRAILEWGPSPLHRRTFKVGLQGQLDWGPCPES
jgi:ribonuclease HII